MWRSFSHLALRCAACALLSLTAFGADSGANKVKMLILLNAPQEEILGGVCNILR